MKHWIDNAIFYHIYPLGFCGAPYQNDFSSPANPRLEKIHSWLDHIQWLGANAIYLGPLFESGTHGYDTADYYWVDRRLGNNENLARLSADLHGRGMRLVLDGVFNHVGRNFWAFRDLLAHGQNSAYRDWFVNLRFDRRSPYKDPFSYEGWNGHYDLVKLNLNNPAVKEHLFGAVESWMREFNIDGLRLDAADCLEASFMRELAAFCHARRPDFWLMGEVIHGDYRQWANPQTLDSVTNYEAYKGLYSSHNDANYFEIAYSLDRQFGPQGLYRDALLYSFADNHDVNRLASTLTNPAHLFPLYALLFSMPGIPSIYYGSEWGLPGKREKYSDLPLRPNLNLAEVSRRAPRAGLAEYISRLAQVRQGSQALQSGSYRSLQIEARQFAFARELNGERIVVAVNAADQAVRINLKIEEGSALLDLLEPTRRFDLQKGSAAVELGPYQARIMRVLMG
jgi:cyclomaltodextrinase / maltogenic alpha-amylase / neopullulanase